jgi:UDP-N-acetylglucosamine/UDP-N-acetylgalactosamine diphosphorylase
MNDALEALHERLDALGQGHVLSYASELAPERRAKLLEQLDALDIDEALRAFRQATSTAPLDDKRQETYLPLGGDVLVSLPSASESEIERWRSRGLRAISDGRVAAIVLAGGQGTRLGFAHPKGQFEAEAPSHATLFQVGYEEATANTASRSENDRQLKALTLNMVSTP